jgi:hypothetical protein
MLPGQQDWDRETENDSVSYVAPHARVAPIAPDVQGSCALPKKYRELLTKQRF